MPLDEAGEQDQAGDVGRLEPPVTGADAGYVLPGDRDVGLELLAGEDRQDAAAREHEVRRLVPAGDGQAVRQIG